MKNLFDYATKEIEELQKSLIYKMSLGSKELYHSNVWAWLIDQDPAFAKAFIPEINDNYVFKRVTREERHRDLTIWYKKPDGSEQFYIVENKLKSIPHIEQLEEYTEDAGDKDKMIEGVLTGICRPVIMDGKDMIPVKNKTWHFVSYESLSNKMKAIAHASPKEIIKDNIKLIDEYLDNNRRVQTIVTGLIKNDSFTLVWQNEELNDDDKSALDNLGLADLINKLAGSSLVSYVNERLTADGFDREFFYTYESFHNKKPTLDFRLSNGAKFDKKECTFLGIGIQIEGNQYRRMIDRYRDYCSTEAIFNEFVEKGFFAKSIEKGHNKEKIIQFPNDDGISRPTNMNKPFDKYGTTCVYQYSTLSDEDLKFENLYKRIKKDILLSKILMEENNKKPFREKME